MSARVFCCAERALAAVAVCNGAFLNVAAFCFSRVGVPRYRVRKVLGALGCLCVFYMLESEAY